MLDQSLGKLRQVTERLTLDGLKLMAKNRGVKGYKTLSEKRSLNAIIKPEFHNERLKNIRKDLNKSRHKFFKSEIK